MTLLPTDTPLYNHQLPEIEQWLISMGCTQDDNELHCWHIHRPDWQAEISLEIEELTVRYHPIADRSGSGISQSLLPGSANDRTIYRTFKYSLSRQDIENAVFAGP